MEKIKLKINFEELQILCKVFEKSNIQGNGFDNKELKLIKNITKLLYNKLRKLLINKEFNNKKFTIKFQYFEAYFLEKIIISNSYLFTDQQFEMSILTKLIFELNRQLI